jgi:hypothetical protein
MTHLFLKASIFFFGNQSYNLENFGKEKFANYDNHLGRYLRIGESALIYFSMLGKSNKTYDMSYLQIGSSRNAFIFSTKPLKLDDWVDMFGKLAGIQANKFNGLFTSESGNPSLPVNSVFNISQTNIENTMYGFRLYSMMKGLFCHLCSLENCTHFTLAKLQLVQEKDQHGVALWSAEPIISDKHSEKLHTKELGLQLSPYLKGMIADNITVYGDQYDFTSRKKELLMEITDHHQSVEWINLHKTQMLKDFVLKQNNTDKTTYITSFNKVLRGSNFDGISIHDKIVLDDLAWKLRIGRVVLNNPAKSPQVLEALFKKKTAYI